jgi:polyisoprenoid-binding protein YceI
MSSDAVVDRTRFDIDGILAEQRTWYFDPWHTAVHFVTRNRGAGHVRGRFLHSTGFLTSGADVTAARISAVIDTRSLTTGVAARDHHLRSADFFDVERHPAATFESTAVIRDGVEEMVVVGELLLKGEKHTVHLATRWEGTADDPFSEGVTHLALSATTTLRLSEVGMGQALNRFRIPGIGDTVDLTLDVVLLPYDPAPKLADIPID